MGRGFRQGTAARWEAGPQAGQGAAETQRTGGEAPAVRWTPAVDSLPVSGTSHFPWGTFVSKGQSHPTPILQGSEEPGKGKEGRRMAQHEGAV